MAEDVTFIVHSEWLDAIKMQDKNIQDAIIGDFVRYGTGLPLIHEDDPNINMAVNLLKSRIDYSKEKYSQKVEGGKTGGRKKKISDREIYEKARIYPNNSQIVAEILGCSKSKVDHSEGWRQRNSPIFKE